MFLSGTRQFNDKCQLAAQRNYCILVKKEVNVLTTLVSSEALMGALIGATVTLLGVLINNVMENLKEARRERISKLSEVRKELGLDKGVQGTEVMLFITSQRPWWSRALLVFGIVMHHPDLSNADLRRVNLAGKNLRGVNFSYANLTEADLSGTNLKNANFRGAILIKTNFYGARFDDNTNFWEAVVYDTPGISDSAYMVGITNMSKLEQRFGRAISSPEDFEKLFISNRIDTTSIPIKSIYWDFVEADKRSV